MKNTYIDSIYTIKDDITQEDLENIKNYIWTRILICRYVEMNWSIIMGIFQKVLYWIQKIAAIMDRFITCVI